MTADLEDLARITQAILCPPFEWCHVSGGRVTLLEASSFGGTKGGEFQTADFAIAKYPITNAQYQCFPDDPNGYSNVTWWGYSPEARQWHKDHPNPQPTAFDGSDLPRTRISWFDSLAFCGWLSAKLQTRNANTTPFEVANLDTWHVRLPIEQEWQRAALGDQDWQYPWGNQLDEKNGNYGNSMGHPTSVGSYPQGRSPYGAEDMIGNVWEWCLTPWGLDGMDISGYSNRVFKGGAWNVSNPEHLRANDRYGHPQRGRLNDAGFRIAFYY